MSVKLNATSTVTSPNVPQDVRLHNAGGPHPTVFRGEEDAGRKRKVYPTCQLLTDQESRLTETNQPHVSSGRSLVLS
ncbi:hypothetical protein EYF80_001740 [Liparis tanakae]|uniref:Uncharacterized protein n=1 Tax=Liparis tanakae TaxID=230148 RepID=A0A4Z2JD55_9TELE|nr:hypothetical protein EYF80_001740 [Liparis tanakae]